MNLFEIVFLDGVLLIFPMLIFLIYLSTNKNIDSEEKNFYFNLTLISSFFLTYKYGVKTPPIIPLLILNSIVIISFIKNRYILANLFSVLILLIYYNYFNYIYILLFIYILVDILYVLKCILKIKNILFIELSVFIISAIYALWIYRYNKAYLNINNIILLISGFLFIVNIIYLIYETGETLLNKSYTLKELQKEKQIRLSLFKITHEIKNPIAVCKGYLDMINVHDTKQVERYIPIIKSEIERLISLLQDFLLINKSNLDLDIMDLNLLVEDTTKKLKPLLNENKIDLNLDILDEEIFINGDYNRLSQVLINLIKNSIEAIKINGNITITSAIKNKEYNLIIEDNGEGMDIETLNRIKEPFFTTKKRGSGLGVSLSYEIIEAHNGSIEYESEYGKGTKVVLHFPICE